MAVTLLNVWRGFDWLVLLTLGLVGAVLAGLLAILFGALSGGASTDTEPPPPGEADLYRITGRVASRTSPSMGDLRVTIVDKSVGGDTFLAEVSTDPRGNYAAEFRAETLKGCGNDMPDLLVRVFSGERFLSASAVRYNASTTETLNVLLDETASATLQSEYETLLADIAVCHKGILGELQEQDDREDIPYLANKSGWDARAVALAASADNFSRRAQSGRRQNRTGLFLCAVPVRPACKRVSDLSNGHEDRRQRMATGHLSRRHTGECGGQHSGGRAAISAVGCELVAGWTRDGRRVVVQGDSRCFARRQLAPAVGRPEVSQTGACLRIDSRAGKPQTLILSLQALIGG
ncbi:hypothetical protein [Rhodococcus sp. NPDC058521]|uniref:hypothetical protein n=1 Tax=Rhodococcus sp. NPDC058521 TaxID=3346536 RepID=UPI003658C94C